MPNFNTPTTEKTTTTWLTPPDIIAALGPFDLDPCTPPYMPWETAAKRYTPLDDGLSKEWCGRVWLNPPYGKQTFLWLNRLRLHGSGIALIFARTETQGFQDVVFPHAHSLLFVRRRICFYDGNGKKMNAPNAPSVFVSYSLFDTAKLREALDNGRIEGALVRLK